MKIEDMLKELDWISINQLWAETRLLEAWKTTHEENYCMQDLLKRREKSGHISTRWNEQNLFQTSQDDRFSNGSFVQKTTKIWNISPKSVKEAKTLTEAKRAIRLFVKSLPI